MPEKLLGARALLFLDFFVYFVGQSGAFALVTKAGACAGTLYESHFYTANPNIWLTPMQACILIFDPAEDACGCECLRCHHFWPFFATLVRR